jgi:hypothetical protein
MRSLLAVVFFASAFVLQGVVLNAQSIQATNYDGGSIKSLLWPGYYMNEKSSLRRTWFVLNDTSCPVQLLKTGVNTHHRERAHEFRNAGEIQINQNVQAIEIRYIIFDVFGDFITTLTSTEVADIPKTDSHKIEVVFRRVAESNASTMLSVAAFVAQVRTEDGKIWRYDDKAINEALARIHLKVAHVDLNPNKEE